MDYIKAIILFQFGERPHVEIVVFLEPHFKKRETQNHVIFRTPQKLNTFIWKKTWEKNDMCGLWCGKGIGFFSRGLNN